jgi:hypothetical protein
VSQGSTSADFNASQRTPQETAALRLSAMQGVVTLVRSLAKIVDVAVTPTAGDAASDGDGDGDDDVAGARAGVGIGVDDGEDGDAGAGRTVDDSGAAAAMSLVESYDLRVRCVRLCDPSFVVWPRLIVHRLTALSPLLLLSCCSSYSQKRLKEETTRAAIRFKSKPRDGIAYLVKIGRCEDTPQSIAAAFHELQDVLDKTMIGDYMGGEKEMNIKVTYRRRRCLAVVVASLSPP